MYKIIINLLIWLHTLALWLAWVRGSPPIMTSFFTMKKDTIIMMFKDIGMADRNIWVVKITHSCVSSFFMPCAIPISLNVWNIFHYRGGGAWGKVG